MKPGKVSRQNVLSTLLTEEEIEVAEILLDLGNSVAEPEESRRKFSWGNRRKRSALDATPSPAPAPSSSPSPASVQRTEIDVETRVKPEATTSPTTPLSYSPSESDEKCKHSSKDSKKRKRDEYLEMIEALTQRRDLLKGEVENVKNYYNKLMAYNLELKSMKQKVLTSYRKREVSHMRMNKFLSFDMNLVQHYQMNAVGYHQPFILDQMDRGSSPSSEKFQYQFLPMAQSSNGLGNINHVGPVRIPDLNLSAEEAYGVDSSQPLDVNRDVTDRRARFAEARRLRRGLMKMKSGSGGVKYLRSR